jgi:uncharacterized membrane protein
VGDRQLSPQGGLEQPRRMTAETAESLRTIAVIVWVAHLAGLVTSGLGNLVAVILAYVKRGDAAGSVYRSHLDQAIALFWWLVAGWLISVAIVVASVGLGWPVAALIGIALLVLLLYKAIKGLVRANARQAFDA